MIKIHLREDDLRENIQKFVKLIVDRSPIINMDLYEKDGDFGLTFTCGNYEIDTGLRTGTILVALRNNENILIALYRTLYQEWVNEKDEKSISMAWRKKM